MKKRISTIISVTLLTFSLIAQQAVTVGPRNGNATFLNNTNVSQNIKQRVPGGIVYDLSGLNINNEKCGTGAIHDYLMNNDAAYKADMDKTEAIIQKNIAEIIKNKNQKAPPPVYTIPVVFHVIHKGQALGTGPNISDAQIQSAVDALNRDYRRTNADGGIAQGAGPDTEIQFCLANRDPQGNSHTGINRISGNSVSGYQQQGITSSNESAVKNLSKWPTKDYVNIWVVAEINDNNADQPGFSGGTIGYAYMPGSNPSSNPNDGIVALFNAIGNDPNGSKGYNLWSATKTNRTLTHEMGHHMNLFHTFGNSCTESNCQTDNDKVCDTPPTTQSSMTSCAKACNNTQQIENYMDYKPESCQNMFSQGQSTRMRAVVATGGPRASLINSQGCAPALALDAGITQIVSPTGTICSTTFTPVVELKNFGSSTLTSVTIKYDVDGGTSQNYAWTGSLGTGSTVNVTLPSVTTTTGAHTFNSSTTAPNGGTDQNTTNDKSSGQFTSTQGNALTLTIVLDKYGSETTWEIKSGTTVIQSGGPYQDNASGTVINIPICVANGCYDLIFYDSYGDGMCCQQGNGSFTLKDSSGTTLASGGTFTTSVTKNFCVPSAQGPPKADFVANVTQITVGGTVQFTDLSTGNPAVTTWNWNFGDGNTSTQKNPSNQYNQVGLFSVKLKVTSAGGADSLTKTNYIQVDSAQTNPGPSCDTLNYPLQGTPVLYTLQNNGGYVAGNNSYKDKAKADFFNNYQPYTQVTGAILGFAKANAAGPNSTVTVAVWNNSGTGGKPGTIIGSQTVSIGTIVNNITAQQPTVVTFATPINIPGNFYLGVVLSNTAGDTVALITNTNGDTNPGIAWEQWSDNSWWPYSDTNSWGINVAHAIFPIVCSGNTGCPTITANITKVNATCGNNNGTASVSSSGGASPYTYSWSNGQTSSSISGLSSGTYTVTVKDKNNCTVTNSVTISNSTPPSLTTTSNNASCGASDGSATASASGGTNPYTYSWSNGATGASISGLASGIYTVTATDSTGCTASKSVTINSAGNMNVTTNVTNSSCQLSCDGSATATASGGATPYTYSWSSGGSAATESGLCAGQYTVTVTDNAGCTFLSNVNIGTSPAITLSTNTTAASCNGNNGSASVTVSGGTSPYTYFWSNGGTTSTITGVSPGTYNVTVTDNKGCDKATSATVGNSGGVTANITPQQTTVCAGNSVTLTASGGSTYAWSTSQTTPSIIVSPSNTTTYTVTVSDQNGCTDTKSSTVTVNQKPVVTVTSSADTVCKGQSVTLTASGASTYAWNTGATTASITVYPNSTTTYYVMGYNGNCASTQQPITVNTYPLSPTANAGSDVTTTYISQGGTVNFNSNGSIGTSFGWDFTGNGSVDDTTANPTHNYTAAGTYNAILYVTLGSCTDADTIQIQVFNMVGLNERDSENMVLSVFPNPAKESITVNLKLTSEDDVTIRITNSVGEIVNFINRKKATLINENINIDSFASGVYFINVISTTESITKRVIIMD